ncbi:MAG: ROK family protein [Myxococcales bacterium]
MRIGIDLGGTKIEGVILNGQGDELCRDRVATPHADYQAVIEAVAALITTLEAAAAVGQSRAGASAAPGVPAVDMRPAATVGVATPGFLSPEDHLIRNSNLLVLNGHPVDGDLGRRLGRPVRVENDANCFVLSEATDGAAALPADRSSPKGGGAPADVVFGATLGTGIGGGLVINGTVWGGTNGSAGEWSHTTLPFWREEDGPGGGCFCGHPRCIESFLSGRGLAWDHQRAGGDQLSPVEIGHRAADGDPRALQTFSRYEDRLARALAGVINLLDPRVIVLGGGISNNVRLFTNVPGLCERYTVSRALRTKLVRATHGDASGVRGAAWLWPSAPQPK